MNEPIKRGGVYMVQLEDGNGSEQSGIRPFLVLQNDKGNQHSPTYTGVPLTTELKSLYMPTHIIANDDQCLQYKSVLLVEQMKSLSRKRFISYLGMLEANILKQVELAVIVQLNLRDIDELRDLMFAVSITKINASINMYICGKCVSKLRKIKEMAIHGLPTEDEDRDFCSICRKAKGRKFRVVNRKRLNRHEKKNEARIAGKAHSSK